MQPEQDAIRALYEKLLEGWNQRRAEEMAALFDDSGIVVGFDGSQMIGRRAVSEELARIFADHRPARYVGIVRTVTLFGADVAVLHAVAGMVPPGQRALKAENNAVQILTAVKRQERWRIVAYQNTPARLDGRPQLAAALTTELDAAMKARGSKIFEE